MVELGLSPTSPVPSLDNMPEAEKIQAIKDWFHSNFEDPVHETPYDSGEGGYQFIWGGPYEAHEELESAFGDQVPAELIERIAQELVDEDGTWDWAPNGNRIESEDEDYDPRVASGEIVDGDGDWPPLVALEGNRSPQSASRETLTDDVLRRLSALESHLHSLDLPAGIGHNRPPEPIEETLIDDRFRQQVQVNIGEIKIEIQASPPKIDKLEEKANRLKRAATAVRDFILKKGYGDTLLIFPTPPPAPAAGPAPASAAPSVRWAQPARARICRRRWGRP
jgi:hypothetical protein